MVSAVGSGTVPSPQSEAVTSVMQELSLQSVPSLLPLKERKNVLQLKLQQRRTREELVSQGIMPPLKSPAAFHEQRRSLERARTEDYLKRKIRSRPERSELVRMHILEETSAEPSLQAKQLKLKRARLADDLNDKISHRPGPIELVHKNILPVHTLIGTESPKGESSSLDEDSSDALSPDPQGSQDSPMGLASQHSPYDMLNMNGDLSPIQFLRQAPSPLLGASDSSPPQNLANEITMTNSSRPPTGQTKQSKSSTDRTSQRPKKPKDNKPKVKKLKYHQYIPPDQKNDREPPPQLDSSYAKILHQQQLFLQLQIINQQQQHYNYHTILPAPPKLPAEKQQPSTNPGPSQTTSTCSTASSSQNGPTRQSQPTVGGAKPSNLPANLDEFKVAELKHELKLRGLTVSGTKNDLIERLKNYQEQNCSSSVSGAGAVKTVPAQLQQVSTQSSGAVPHQAKDTTVKMSAFPMAATTRVRTTTPPQIMRFSSTSSSPPVSPTPSDRSLAGLSPDETSCNGDVFGEMVSSPLTQLTLHPSPEHPSPIKEEPLGQMQASCRLSHPSPLSAAQPQDPALVTAAGSAVPTLDKDQMLQEKDKQIEELTRMLRQKQRLVETLRSQLEQGKRGAATDGMDSTITSEIPSLPNGVEVRVKEEIKVEMDTSEDLQKQVQPPKKMQTQCSQQTLLKLQQNHRLQVQQQQQLQQQHMLVELPNVQKLRTQLLEHRNQQQQMQVDLTKLQQEQGKTQVLQQQQQKTQLLQQQKTHLQQHQQQLKNQLQHQQQTTQVLQKKQQNQLQQQQQKNQLQQQKKIQLQQKKIQLLQQQQQQKLQQLIIQQSQQKQLQTNQKQQKSQNQQQQQLQTPQISQVFVNHQSGTQFTTSFPLDLLKAHATPTLVTDSNGNRYLIALTSNSVDSLTGKSPQSKSNGRITLQRLQSTPTKLPSQSSSEITSSVNQSQAVREPITKVQKLGLHLNTTTVQEFSQPVSAPPSFEPFFCEESNPLSKSSSPPSFKEEVCPTFDRHTLFTPSSPKPNPHLPQPFKENVSNNQQIDDLFEILIKSGEISSGLKANQDPSLSDLHSSPPTPSPPPFPLHLSPATHHPDPNPSQQLPDTQGRPCLGTGRLEDFLESTTGAPLLGAEPDGPLTLIDDLHNQMLSTSSILDHPSSPMDTSDLSFSPHPTSLYFEDPTLDGMDWLDIPVGGGNNNCNSGGMVLAPLSSHTPPSVFSADFLDSSDLQLHWDSCL
ncbi:myocardin-related transcription factor A-like isoform X2 [Myxocyprinus asiaticus]|uniref:myocardin-related transcription factor A-like isoform X2 n=1 Tax=Myxocyprinus asiaticus TaxID=70543 RepID=UPI002221E13E|nr:myocardin-related transcription factor A-like isoform X2 [Myxocyprinus asiaticus]